MEVYLDGNEDHGQCFRDAVLIMPSCNTIHDFGQLVIDIILYNFNFKSVGFLHSEFTIPVAGYIESPESQKRCGLVSGMELYKYVSPQSHKKFFVIQIRTKVKKHMSHEFGDGLRKFAISHAFEKVILVTGAPGKPNIEKNNSEIYDTSPGYLGYLCHGWSSLKDKLYLRPLKDLIDHINSPTIKKDTLHVFAEDKTPNYMHYTDQFHIEDTDISSSCKNLSAIDKFLENLPHGTGTTRFTFLPPHNVNGQKWALLLQFINYDVINTSLQTANALADVSGLEKNVMQLPKYWKTMSIQPPISAY